MGFMSQIAACRLATIARIADGGIDFAHYRALAEAERRRALRRVFRRRGLRTAIAGWLHRTDRRAF